MRGKVPHEIPMWSIAGITPAYAGKSLLELVAVVGGRDHPRLCGEKHFVNVGIICNWGITPAYAGKSKVNYLNMGRI